MHTPDMSPRISRSPQMIIHKGDIVWRTKFLQGPTLVPDRCGNPDSAYFINCVNSDWIEIPHSAIQNTPVNVGLILSLWINLYDTAGQGILGKQPSGSCSSSHSPTTSNHGGLLVITVDVADSTKEILKFYINGELADDHVYDVYSSPILSQASTEPIRIGKRKDSDFGPPGPAYFWGAMDDVRLYNRPLTAAEVLALYQVNACQTPNTIEALVKGVELRGVSCVNLTTGQFIRIVLKPGQTNVNCTQSGLEVAPGDKISILPRGLAPERTKSATRDSDTWIPVHPLLG